MDCRIRYLQYKKTCKVIYSDISCEENGIEKMDTTELISYLKKFKALYKQSVKCYLARTDYKHDCVEEKKWDLAHDYAIKQSKEFSLKCESQIAKINKRFNEIAKEHYALQQLKKEMDQMTIQTKPEQPQSPSSSSPSSLSKKKKKKANPKIQTTTYLDENFDKILAEYTKELNETNNEQTKEEQLDIVEIEKLKELIETLKQRYIKDIGYEEEDDQLYPTLQLISNEVYAKDLDNLNMDEIQQLQLYIQTENLKKLIEYLLLNFRQVSFINKCGTTTDLSNTIRFNLLFQGLNIPVQGCKDAPIPSTFGEFVPLDELEGMGGKLKIKTGKKSIMVSQTNTTLLGDLCNQGDNVYIELVFNKHKDRKKPSEIYLKHKFEQILETLQEGYIELKVQLLKGIRQKEKEKN